MNAEIEQLKEELRCTQVELALERERSAQLGAAPRSSLAFFDPLTRLPTRSLLQERVTQALAASESSGLLGALLFIDVDNFKGFNEAEGHAAGDLLMVELATRLRATVRMGDTVARLGGDEYVIMLENLSHTPQDATRLAKLLGSKLVAAMATPIHLRGFKYQCQLSIGVSLLQHHDTIESLFMQGAQALQQAKNEGGNTLCFFDSSMQSTMDLRRTLSAELEKALQWQQLRLFYQPQVDETQRVTGVEALLRWHNPMRGMVPPIEFIQLAEASSLIVSIGLWVLNTACTQIKTWESNPHACHLQVAVNVSARQFRQPDFVELVQKALTDSGANPARLKLELTESLVLENIRDAIAKMKDIKKLGVSFSMDDFGTGYSSLSYLSQLPIDQLKIDKSFIENIPGKSGDETIVRTIIAMGRGLNMHVIAEGVETDAQRDCLAQHGCHAFQGYLFSRPVPVDQLEAYLSPIVTP